MGICKNTREVWRSTTEAEFLQFESHRSKTFKVRAISSLRDLYGTSLAFMFYTSSRSPSTTLKLYRNTNLEKSLLNDISILSQRINHAN